MILTPQEPQPTRYHPRVDAGLVVRLAFHGSTAPATATDLSMAGMKVSGITGDLPERLRVSIPIPGDRDVETMATVRRRSRDAAALEFDQLDWDDMIALARFVHPRMP